MSNELVRINPAAIQQGGLGINLNSKYLKNVKPATISIVQPNSQVDGVPKGSLYVKEWNQSFQDMRCALLEMPEESRWYYLGNPGELNRSPDNLLCFSTDLIAPHPKAKIPQSLKCANCPKADWGPWREYKEKNGMSSKALIPPCDAQITALLVDKKLKQPLRMYIRATSKDSFDDGMENIARLLLMKQAAGENPNVFDISFKLSTKLIQRGKYQNYVPVISEPTWITPEERNEFGVVFEKYVLARQQAQNQDDESKPQVDKNEDFIEGEVIEGEIIV